MRIADVAYVSKNIGEAVLPPSEDFKSLSEGLSDDAKKASRIIIISAYFGEDYILELLASPSKKRRAQCVVQIVLGYDNTTEFVYGQVKIDNLRRAIFDLGYRKKRVFVRLFKDAVPLHAKIYGFLITTAPVWYVGSANASSAIKGDRHELMVRVTGRSDALEKYIGALLAHKGAGGPSSSGGLSGLQEFFSHGFLLFKPTRHRRFTYEAFSISPSERRKISDQLGLDSSVPHSDPAAEGFGFNLLSALGVESDVKEDKTTKLRFRRYCVETVYGYWVPAVYERKINNALEASRKSETNALERIAKSLTIIPDKVLIDAFENYRRSSVGFFNRTNVKAIPKKDAIASFQAFLDVRRTWLGDSNWIKRNASRVSVEKMPDIWSDQSASERFMSSFFDDMAAVLNAPERIPFIYRVFQRRFELIGVLTADAIRDRLAIGVKSGQGGGIF